MPVPERSPSSIAALGDKELEILRLLTAGHTVKSIAVRLGRSEASINERLRDARRKTGVGSSRELARLLDAQKIWDKNIGLSARTAAPEGAGQPAEARRHLPKGTIVMLFTLPIAAAALFITTAQPADPVVAPQAAEAPMPSQSPLIGRWALDITRIPAEERPRSVTLEFRMSRDQLWTGSADIVGPDGSSQHAQSTARMDGVPVQLTGNMIFADTVSMRQPAPNTLVMTFEKNGAPVSTRVYTVESDQQSMKETIIWAGSGTPRMVTTYFNRTG